MPGAAVVHVSSVRAFAPLPSSPIHSATMAAINSFSRSLRAQLKETSVKVFELVSPVVDAELPHPQSPEMARVMKLGELVRQFLEGIEKDQFEIRPGQADGPQFMSRVATAVRTAQDLISTRRYAEAIAPLSQAAQLAPTDPAVLYQLGHVCLLARRLPEAATWFRRTIAISPTAARAHFDLGAVLVQTGDEDGALECLRCATVLEPKHAESHGRAGDILRRKNALQDAASYYERAFEAAPGTAYGLLCKGKALVALERVSEAEAYLKEAIARAASDDRTRVEAEYALGDTFLQAGRFDEARASFERLIELAPGDATLHLSLVRIKNITEEDRPIVKRLLDRLDAPGLPERQRMTLHFAAGKAFDDLRDYGSAIEHFDAANRIRRKTRSFDAAEHARRIDELIARFSRDFFLENAALGNDDETPVLVLGMPRSGTTLVERILSSHPRVGGGGERGFWSNNAPAWANVGTRELVARADGLREDYLCLLRSIAPDALRVTDKTTANFLYLGLVHTLFPKARIVHCRRNPVDTCLSIYATQFGQTWGFESDRGDLAAYYRQYLRLMDHWRRVLPSDRLLDVDYEEAVVASEATARRLVAFCGLEWDPACLHPERNPDRIRTASVWQARQPIYDSSVERWRNYEPWLGELRELL